MNGIDAESVASWELSPEPREAATARRLVRGQLRSWGLAGLTETVELLVSEVVTNAVRHASGRRAELRLVARPSGSSWR